MKNNERKKEKSVGALNTVDEYIVSLPNTLERSPGTHLTYKGRIVGFGKPEVKN